MKIYFTDGPNWQHFPSILVCFASSHYAILTWICDVRLITLSALHSQTHDKAVASGAWWFTGNFECFCDSSHGSEGHYDAIFCETGSNLIHCVGQAQIRQVYSFITTQSQRLRACVTVFLQKCCIISRECRISTNRVPKKEFFLLAGWLNWMTNNLLDWKKQHLILHSSSLQPNKMTIEFSDFKK